MGANNEQLNQSMKTELQTPKWEPWDERRNACGWTAEGTKTY